MTTRIKVGIRLRPFLEWEENKGYMNSRIEVDQDSNEIKVIEDSKRPRKAFKFDHVFGVEADQNAVYSGAEVDGLIQKASEGYHCTLFAYGQTGSGKTYTMEGYEYDISGESEEFMTSGPLNLTSTLNRPKPKLKQDSKRFGIVPRAISRLFEILKEKGGNTSTDYNVSCSFLQIYNEKIYDLLNPSTIRSKASDGQITLSQGLRLRWSAQDQFQVENLFVCECKNADEVMSYYNFGIRNRITASHKLNMASSRSHTILTLRIEQINPSTQTSTFSRIQLVDLAGSERIGQTGTEGKLAKESIEINKSLFILRQVITTLSEIHRQAKSKDITTNTPHIPYRESKLTSLLKQSIGGNSYCLMLACINPCDEFLEENLSTLNYATKATYIKNEPVLNNDPRAHAMQSLRVDIKQLRLELDKANQHIAFLTNLTNDGQNNSMQPPHPAQCCSSNCKYQTDARLREGSAGGTSIASNEEQQQNRREISDENGANKERYNSPYGNIDQSRLMQSVMMEDRSQPMVSETATNFASLNDVLMNSPGKNKFSALQQQVRRFENRQRNISGTQDSFSDRLLESIAMVRDLLANNKELREQTDLHIKKAQNCERDLYFLQRENQDLRERISSANPLKSEARISSSGLEEDAKSQQMHLSSSQISNWSRISKQEIIQEVLTLRQEKRALERKVLGNEIEQSMNTGNNNNNNNNKDINDLTQSHLFSPNFLSNPQTRRAGQQDFPKKNTLQPLNLSTTNSQNRKAGQLYGNGENNNNSNIVQTNLSALHSSVPIDSQMTTNFGRNQMNIVRSSYAHNSPAASASATSEQLSSRNGLSLNNIEQIDGLNELKHVNSPPKRRVQSQVSSPDSTYHNNTQNSRYITLSNSNNSNRATSQKRYPQNQIWYPQMSQITNTSRSSFPNNSFQS